MLYHENIDYRGLSTLYWAVLEARFSGVSLYWKEFKKLIFIKKYLEKGDFLHIMTLSKYGPIRKMIANLV